MKMYYHNKCNEYKHNTSKLWHTINEIVGRINDKSCVIDHITVNGVKDYTAHGIGSAFGNFFANIGKRYAGKIPKSKKHIDEYLAQIRRNQTSIFFEPTSIMEINKLLKGLPNKSSSGHDNVNNLLLKEIAEQITPILELLFNESLLTGHFPEKMKIADIVPLYKAKEHDIVDNYRPISLLLTISKVLEWIVYKRVYRYLNDTGQIYESQYGFRENHSCDHAIAQLIGEIVKNHELQKTTISVFLDLSKAFDTLTHSIVLKKLERYRIRGQTLKWFESYLSGRRLRVKFRPASTGKVEVTNEYDIEYGAPQGSCLGPLIFLVFCNDLSLHLEFLQCIQFADDTTLYLGHRNKHYLRYCVEMDLINIQDWFNANRLTLNCSKTVYMLFDNRTSTSEPVLKVNNVPIPRVEFTKFLGLWIDDKLNWQVHVKKLEQKLKSKLGMLYKSKNLLSSGTKRILYFGQVYSNLSYGIGLLGPMVGICHINKLIRVQNKCISKINPSLCTADVYKAQRLLDLHQIIRLEQLKLGYKLCNSMLPPRITKEMLTDQNSKNIQKTHPYGTRKKNIPNRPNTRHQLYMRSYLYQAPLAFESLPKNLRSIQSYRMYVKECKLYLLGLKTY